MFVEIVVRRFKRTQVAYSKQRQNFDKLDFDFPFEAIWDDNDYGLGDGKRISFKR